MPDDTDDRLIAALDDSITTALSSADRITTGSLSNAFSTATERHQLIESLALAVRLEREMRLVVWCRARLAQRDQQSRFAGSETLAPPTPREFAQAWQTVLRRHVEANRAALLERFG